MATTVLVVQLDGNLRTVAAGIEPEHVDLICSGLLALVDRLRQYQSAPPTQATKADVVQMRPGFPRISNQ